MSGWTGLDSQSINERNIRQSLEAIHYTTTRKATNPLTGLMWVEHFLTTENLSHTMNHREIALNQLLTSLISEAFGNHCYIFGLTSLVELEMRQHALDRIALDAQTKSEELLGWSWLYHHYVRPELNIGVADFCAAAAIDDRTLRRYQSHTLRQLTQRVIAKEQRVRTEQRRHRLHHALPYNAGRSLFGRSKALAHVQRILAGSRPHHILVTGEQGVGKSAFVEEAVRLQIDRDAFEQLVWINLKEAAEDFEGEFLRQLPGLGKLELLWDYSAVHRLSVVFDGVEASSPTSRAFVHLLRQLGKAEVYITSCTYIPLETVHAHIALAPLATEEAARFIRFLVEHHYHEEEGGLLDDELCFVLEQAGGIPQNIINAVHSLHATYS